MAADPLLAKVGHHPRRQRLAAQRRLLQPGASPPLIDLLTERSRMKNHPQILLRRGIPRLRRPLQPAERLPRIGGRPLRRLIQHRQAILRRRKPLRRRLPVQPESLLPIDRHPLPQPISPPQLDHRPGIPLSRRRPQNRHIGSGRPILPRCQLRENHRPHPAENQRSDRMRGHAACSATASLI